MDKKGVRGLKDALAEAAGKFSPDRTVLPIPDRTFGGTIGRTIDAVGARLDDDPRAEGARGRAERAGRPDRRRRLRRPGHVRRPDRDPEPHAGAADGAHLQPVPRDRGVLADPRGAADRPQPPPGRLRLDRRVPRPVPRLHGGAAPQLHRAAAHPAGERLRHRRVRQVAPDAGQRAGRGRPVRPLAAVVGLRPLVGVPVRGGRPVRPDHHPGQLDARRARRARTASRTTSPTT